MFRDFKTGDRQRTDFLCRGLTAFGQLSYFRCDHGEASALLSRAGCFDGGVEGEQVGLISDLFNNRNLLRNGLHGIDGFQYRRA